MVSRHFFILAALTGLVFSVSCGGDLALPVAKAVQMGDRAEAGGVTYVGLTAEYRTELPGAKDPLKNRYLVVFLAVTNGSGQDVTLPHTRLIGADGSEIPELTEIGGFPQWMGILRQVSPGSTEQGYVVFDVPVGAYKLQVSSGGDPEKEKIAQIEIPANIIPSIPSGVSGPSLGK